MMKENSLRPVVHDIMNEFSDLTGITSAGEPPRRYLWTDAFAVCNFLGLYRQTGDEQYKNLALQLTDQVHHILGRHRKDDSRNGWISGLDEEGGTKHPTKGGLRIGKVINERAPSDPFDEGLEWDRDGQYYHYLTKWMHALNRLSQASADTIYNSWAIELAKTTHAKFTYTPPFSRQKYLYWKMSIDLSRPLVPSMGHHDPLDGFITYNQLRSSASNTLETSMRLNLDQEIADLANICKGKSWVTDDSLGIGGLLCHAYQVAQMMSCKKFEQPDLLETLLESSLLGLELYAKVNPLNLPAENRLAFREFGLSIGMRAAKALQGMVADKANLFETRSPLRSLIEELVRYTPLIEIIERFWLASGSRESDSWMEHRDINRVMLATSLSPDGFLGI